jgi:hypothetical protein
VGLGTKCWGSAPLKVNGMAGIVPAREVKQNKLRGTNEGRTKQTCIKYNQWYMKVKGGD